MKLSEYAIGLLVPFVTGDGHPPYRKGPALVQLFNKYGARDKYDFTGGFGLPDIGKANGHRPSRTEYTDHRLNGLSGSAELRGLLQEIFNELQPAADILDTLNGILKPEGFSVTSDGGQLKIEGGVIDNRKPVVNQAHFQRIQDQVLAALDKAALTIDVAMAWFTSDVLRDKLLQKQAEGVTVRLVIYSDGVNAKHGVDLTGLNHKMIRGLRGGLMHNKFCVIDNQVAITGSYNWSSNAEYKNDENVAVQLDPEQATRYSLEFRKLFQ